MKNYLISTTVEANDVVHALKRLQNYLEGKEDLGRPIRVNTAELLESFEEEVIKEEVIKEEPPKADFNERDVENRNKPDHSPKPASVGATPTTGMGNLFGGTSWGK